MTDLPIIFSSSMVLALLAGRKTMTRRIRWTGRKAADGEGFRESPWARVKPGDQLWVREGIRLGNHYIADGQEAFDPQGHRFGWVWQRPVLPSIHMPRAYSRLTLVVTATKIEPLTAISHEDAVAEGVGIFPKSMSAQKRFCELWESLHGPGSWNANPEVVALTFTVHKQNIDSMKEAA